MVYWAGHTAGGVRGLVVLVAAAADGGGALGCVVERPVDEAGRGLASSVEQGGLVVKGLLEILWSLSLSKLGQLKVNIIKLGLHSLLREVCQLQLLRWPLLPRLLSRAQDLRPMCLTLMHRHLLRWGYSSNHR